MADQASSCSFCGKPAEEAVQLFGADADPGPPNAAICDECVLTCAKAIDVEKRLSERPRAKPRGDAAPDSERGPAAGWAAFEIGSLKLEWQARPAKVVSVRRSDNHERVVVQHFALETEPDIDDAESIAEDHWGTLHG